MPEQGGHPITPARTHVELNQRISPPHGPRVGVPVFHEALAAFLMHLRPRPARSTPIVWVEACGCIKKAWQSLPFSRQTFFNETMGVVMFSSMGQLSPNSIGNHKQPLATTGNQTASAQRELALIGVVSPLHRLGDEAVAKMDFSACLGHAAMHLGLSNEAIADEIHVCHGYMSRFMRGVAQAWARRLVAFMRTTQSLAPLEWLALEMGCELVQRSAQAARVQALEAELALLTGRRAA